MGGLLSLQPTVTAPSRLRAAWVLGGSFCQAQSLEGGSLGQEAGRQGYRLATGRTWGSLEGGLKSAKRDEEPSSVYALTGWLSILRVIFGACSEHGLQTHTAFTMHPPAPLL